MGRAKRVLIADDDADVCALLALALDVLADVTCVSDAEAALALLAREPAYDAIICDFMLPGINGLEFVECLRRDRYRVPILMMSGHGKLGVGDSARAAGVNAFLDKPFTLAQLRGTVATLLNQNTIQVA